MTVPWNGGINTSAFCVHIMVYHGSKGLVCAWTD